MDVVPTLAKGHPQSLDHGCNVRSTCRCSVYPAIHTTTRSLLRSSSTHEPSDPPLRVVLLVVKTPLGETQSRGLTLIRPIRKPANLGEAGGTHGEDFSSPVGPVAEDRSSRGPVDPSDAPLVGGTTGNGPRSPPFKPIRIRVLLEGSAKIGAGRHRKG